jgi:hypothetical protein
MLIAKQYFVSNTSSACNQYWARHSEANHTWAAMKELLYSLVAINKHYTNAAFQKLCSAKQGPDKTIMSFSAYIVITCESTDNTNYNKCIFFCTGLRPEIRATEQKGEDYLTINSCLEAGVKAEMALHLDAEYNKAFRSAPKEKATEKARKNKGKQRACDNSREGRSWQGAPQCLQGSFAAKTAVAAVAAMA